MPISPRSDTVAERSYGSHFDSVVEDYSRALGQEVEQSLRNRRFHLASLPEVATTALQDIPVPDELDAVAILRHVAATPDLPQQEDPKGRFGHPPVTLYRGRDFFVSALYWLDGTTSVHQHGFSGAFRVLTGGSLHVRYGFSTVDEVTHRLAVGDLKLATSELLDVGDVRVIEPGDGLIHALFHLERPSVTIVVRSYVQPIGQPQLNYLRPGVAYDPFYRDDLIERRLQSIVTLADMDTNQGFAAARDFLDVEDLWPGFLLALRWAERVDDGAGLGALLDELEFRYGEIVVTLRAAFEQQCRVRMIASRRRLLHDPDHRLFLALLMNLPDRRSVESLIRQRFPGEAPGPVLVRWVSDLSAPAMRGLSGLALSPEALSSLAEAILGSSDALGSIPLGRRPPELLEDLFR